MAAEALVAPRQQDETEKCRDHRPVTLFQTWPTATFPIATIMTPPLPVRFAETAKVSHRSGVLGQSHLSSSDMPLNQ